MLRQLKIDPEFQSKIPPLTFEELSLLETNILEEGRILSPLIVWNGLIVDGHNRFAILKNHPEIKYTILEKEFANRYEAIVWICKNQLGRRNLKPEQFKYLLGQQYEAEKLATNFNGNRFTSGDETRCGQNVHTYKPERTAERIARENNTNERYVRRAGQFSKGVDAAEEVSPGIKQEILTGSIKPTERAVAAIAKASLEERPALVAELCKPKEQKKVGKKEKMASPKIEVKATETEALKDVEPTELLPKPSPEPSLEPISEPVIPAPVKIDNKQLLEIAASRYHAKRRATGSDMLCEIEAAADNLKQRWKQAFQYYPDLLTAPDNRAAVAKIAQSLMDYLKEVEERTE